MSSPSEAGAELAPNAPAERCAEQSAFAGDLGQLPIDTRRVLVQLLSGPSVDGRRHPKLWPTLLRAEDVLRSRLHDLFLDLVVDRDQQVAFTRQALPEDVDAPILLRRANLSFLESALLLLLRQRLTEADAQGERAVVALQEMKEHLGVFERTDNVDRSRFERQVDNAIEKAKRLNLVHRLKGGEDRYEVSPTLKLFFPAEEIDALGKIYERLARAEAATSERPADAEPRSEEEGALDGSAEEFS